MLRIVPLVSRRLDRARAGRDGLVRGADPAAGANRTARGDRSIRREQIRGRRVRRRCRGALRTLLEDRTGGVRAGGHRLGAAAVLRTDMRSGMRLDGKTALITGAGSGICPESPLWF